MVSVLGVVSKVGVLGSVVLKATGQEKMRRGVTLVDESQTSVELTLWGDTAESVDEVGAVNRVLLCRGVRVGDYGGRTLSTVGSSVLEWDPVLESAIRLKQMYMQGSVKEMNALTSGGGGGGGGDVTVVNIKTMNAVDDDTLVLAQGGKANYHVMHGILSAVPVRQVKEGHCNLYYRACTKLVGDRICGKKVGLKEGHEDVWMCADAHEENRLQCKYIVGAKFADATSEQFVRLFDDEAKKLIGMDADELDKWSFPEQERKLQVIIEALIFKPCVLKVRNKKEMYQDEERVNAVVLDLKILDAKDDAKWMLSFVNKFVGQVTITGQASNAL
jgi:replication factor A1